MGRGMLPLQSAFSYDVFHKKISTLDPSGSLKAPDSVGNLANTSLSPVVSRSMTDGVTILDSKG